MELLKILAKRGELVPLVEKVQLIFRTMRVCECVVCRLSVCVWCLSPPSLSVCAGKEEEAATERAGEAERNG